ncbi:MAG TPA: DNA polymerase III subunit delta [Lachnospiraceae bacterium]|nr:DNA polymerase III subunit delta [Lachnospiraceae bacterium]
MKQINEDIKSGQFEQIYLLFGDEGYLRKQYKDKLMQALSAEGDTMNTHYYEGKDINIGKIIDLAETLPFFAERRVIVMENTGFFKSGGEQLATYLEKPAPTVFFVFVEAEVDKRSKVFKLVNKTGHAAEFKVQDDQTLVRWIAGILKKDNKKITENNVKYFLEKTGTEMGNIRTELEKLVCYCMDKDVIEKEDIDAICTTRISNHIFDMVTAIGDKRTKDALNLYYELLALKEQPMRILFLIARQCNMLLQAKQLSSKGFDKKKIGENIGLPPFIASKYIAQASRFTEKNLKEAVVKCVQSEESVKTGRMNDTMSIELLIMSVL